MPPSSSPVRCAGWAVKSAPGAGQVGANRRPGTFSDERRSAASLEVVHAAQRVSRYNGLPVASEAEYLPFPQQFWCHRPAISAPMRSDATTSVAPAPSALAPAANGGEALAYGRMAVRPIAEYSLAGVRQSTMIASPSIDERRRRRLVDDAQWPAGVSISLSPRRRPLR